jgi:hypothetical protein
MKIGTKSPTVGAPGGSHCAAVVIFAGSGFDSRLAFDVHGCARDDHFGKVRFLGIRNAPENGENYLFLAAPPTSGLQPSERCHIVRNDDAKRFCYTQWSAADEQPHDEAGHAKAADHMRKP